MDFIVSNAWLIAVALLSGAMLAWPYMQGGGGAGVTPNAAVQRINRDKAVVIDVCDAQEFANAHIRGARNVPLADLEQKLPGVVKNKATPLVLVCGTGMRSKRAVSVARKLGYEHADSLAGGLKSWREANLPIDSAVKAGA